MTSQIALWLGITFTLGLVIGACLGVIVMCACFLAGRADEWMDRLDALRRVGDGVRAAAGACEGE